MMCQLMISFCNEVQYLGENLQHISHLYKNYGATMLLSVFQIALCSFQYDKLQM